MKKKDKKTPLNGSREEGYICPAASWRDTTGLIPSSDGGEQRDSYDEVNHYLPEYGGNGHGKK